MPEATPGHGHEGWGAREHAGYALVAALYALAFLGCAVAAVLFAIYFPRHTPRPWPQPYPEPRLNGHIDRDPEFSYAPKPVPAAAVEPAMRALAAEGDAGWGPKGGSPRAGAFPGSSEPAKAPGPRP
jgi:hypothetical protein